MSPAADAVPSTDSATPSMTKDARPADPLRRRADADISTSAPGRHRLGHDRRPRRRRGLERLAVGVVHGGKIRGAPQVDGHDQRVGERRPFGAQTFVEARERQRRLLARGPPSASGAAVAGTKIRCDMAHCRVWPCLRAARKPATAVSSSGLSRPRMTACRPSHRPPPGPRSTTRSHFASRFSPMRVRSGPVFTPSPSMMWQRAHHAP